MKTALKNTFDFYLDASIHVAVATSALVLMTYYFIAIMVDWNVLSLVFFGTIFSYNFIKYFALYRNKSKYSNKEKTIVLLTIVAGIVLTVNFFLLEWKTQLVTLVFGLLSIFYAVPISKRKQNLRNISGIKIYIVALCWAGCTLLLPLYQAGILLPSDMFFKFLQRFLLTLILILIFEINDLKYDDIRLKTVPQSIGILHTKYLIYLLLIPFYVLEFFKQGNYPNQWIINLILITVITLFTHYASPHKSKYYTLFWVESVPILWLVLTLWFN